MIINRSHIPWALLTLAATWILAAAYFEVFRPGTIRGYVPLPHSAGNFPYGHRSIGATPLGIAYGTAAYLIFIFATLLGARKKVRHWRIGAVEIWMRAHIWFSILTIPLVLFHCGFHSGSLLTTGLLWLYALVMASGFYGLALQQFIPTQMMDRLSREVIYDQIPFLKKQLVQSAIELRRELTPPQQSASAAPFSPQVLEHARSIVVEDPRVEEARVTLRQMLEQEVLPYLRTGRRSKLRRQTVSDNLFEIVRSSVSEAYAEKVNGMQRWCDQRRNMDLQATMQRWLHYWLLVHVPASMLLLLWTGWHAVTGLLYY